MTTHITGRLVPAALIAAAVAIGGSTLIHPAIGSAEWDIQAYDNCMDAGIMNDVENLKDHEQWCCLKSGGEWSRAAAKCQAPPAANVPQSSPTTQPRVPVAPPPTVLNPVS